MSSADRRRSFRPPALLLLPLVLAVVCLPALADDPAAWQLVEIVDFNTPPGGDYTLAYSRGSITWSWRLGADAWSFTSTWSPPPETIGPRDRVTMRIAVTTNQDVGDQYSAGGSFALFFDRPDIEPGSAGSPIGFTNDQGEGGGTEVRHRVSSPPVSRTVWVDAAKLGTGRPGARVALIVAAYNGRTAGTKYIYEWRGPLTPEERLKLQPPAPPAPAGVRHPAPAAPPPLPGLRDSGARFSSLTGEVEVYHEGQSRKDARFAKPGTILYVGDHVITGEESSAIIGFADLTTHLQKAESEIVITSPPGKNSMIRLVAGNIWRNIKKMATDGTMEVEMWDAAASVKGTTLVCETTPAGSTVKVIEGVVQVRSRTRTQTVELDPGTMVRSSAGRLGPVQAFDVAAESASWEAIRTRGTGHSTGVSAGAVVNLALGGRGTQSSTAFGGAAARAIDGNADGAFPRGSVTHTGNGPREWWQVDLGVSATIERVVVWNRTDCCAERLRSFWVLVSDAPLPAGAAPTSGAMAATWRRQVTGKAGRTTEVSVGARGRYVRIQLDAPDYLSLAEVEVYGR